jgi:hypothetical protein
MKKSMIVQRPPSLLAPQQAPQHYFQPLPPIFFQNPIPHQGVK